jgi:non-ribosomal peptide synthetase component F
MLSPPHVARAVAALPRTSLINGYGPTENTTFTCCHRVSDPAGGAVPIGFPIRGTRVYLLDDDLEPVPDGQTGNLYAAGDGLGHGYLGSPALTATKFLPDPFSQKPGERMYYTGDLACRLPDGSLDYCGRTDQQVKVNGFRIETGEIEAALTSHPQVADAAVVPYTEGERTILVGHVVPSGGAPAPTAAELRAHLAGSLPDHLLPAAFTTLTALPLTANGKVDRRALPAPQAAASTEYQAPASVTEELLAQAFEELLGVERVGVHDNFFELGGDSLLALRLAARINALFGTELSPRVLFDWPTVAQSAAGVEELVLAELEAAAEHS